ncbi:MAG: hypothetical protein ACMXYG_03520 [Candidatus Woesearchaeota archaeon]
MSQKLKQNKKANSIQEETLKQEMDYWVKDFEKKISRTSDLSKVVEENRLNTDYNYELIKELQKEIEFLKKEISKIKNFNVIAMKSRPLKNMD